MEAMKPSEHIKQILAGKIDREEASKMTLDLVKMLPPSLKGVSGGVLGALCDGENPHNITPYNIAYLAYLAGEIVGMDPTKPDPGEKASRDAMLKVMEEVEEGQIIAIGSNGAGLPVMHTLTFAE